MAGIEEFPDFEELHRAQYPQRSQLIDHLVTQLSSTVALTDEHARSPNMKNYVLKTRKTMVAELFGQARAAYYCLKNHEQLVEKIQVPTDFNLETLRAIDHELINRLAHHRGTVEFVDWPDMTEYDSLHEADVTFSGLVRTLLLPENDIDEYDARAEHYSAKSPLEVGVHRVYVGGSLQPIASGVTHHGAPAGTIRVLLGEGVHYALTDPIKNDNLRQTPISA